MRKGEREKKKKERRKERKESIRSIAETNPEGNFRIPTPESGSCLRESKSRKKFWARV